MCNLLKILKNLTNKPKVKDIEVNNPEVIQPKKENYNMRLTKNFFKSEF